MRKIGQTQFRKTFFKVGVAVLATCFLVACSSGPPPPRSTSSPGHLPPAQDRVIYAPNTPSPVPIPRTKPAVPDRERVTASRPVSASASAPGSVSVRKGDTVYAIGRRYAVSPRAIISANGLTPPYRLEIGQRLRLPGGRKHTVGRGDTVYSISRRYGVDMSELTRVNRIRSPYTISVGQVLTLPPQSRAAVATQGASSGSPAARVAVPTPPPRSGSGFVWPANGRVISRFGPKQGGTHNDGINIRVSKGSDVRATEAGVVAYSGNELKGFGNLVLIRHAGGWVSAYAHNSSIIVKRGQKVTRGQKIARAGSSGSVTESQVHFELRKGSRAVDPQKYLPSP